jgi:transposase
MLVKTVLNRCHPLKSFTYEAVRFIGDLLCVDVLPRKGSRPVCGRCKRRGATYDTSSRPRQFGFVPLWGFAVVLLYCMRRVDCRHCGVTTEQVPWAEGKNRTCNAFRLFLARWARRLSWQETAAIFNVSWGVVYRSIRWVVDYGLAARSLEGITAIGVDEIAVWAGQKYLTVVYQIDAGARRLLWVGRNRTEATMRGFFSMFGQARAKRLKFIASDMWQPYLKVVAKMAAQAIHVLDRYHVVAKLNEAIDEIRAKEARELARQGYEPILKHSRWCFLKRPENRTAKQNEKLADLLHYNLRTVRAYLLKESFEAFWGYISPWWAGWFLDKWCTRAMRSRLEPIKRFVFTMRAHRELMLNWFRAKKAISSGTVEGLNANAKLTVRKARGFRSYPVLETALYHTLGHLPEPDSAHRFC